MEVLTPLKEEPKAPVVTGEINPQTADVDFSQASVDAIRYLGLTDSIFDEATMTKVKEISEYFPDIESVDLKLGNPMGTSRLDKIYSYMRLCKQSDDIKRRESLIEEAKSKFINNKNVSL